MHYHFSGDKNTLLYSLHIYELDMKYCIGLLVSTIVFIALILGLEPVFDISLQTLSSNRFITYFDHDLAECIGDR